MDSSNSAEFWGMFFGTAIGVVAGAFVQYVSQKCFAAWQSQNLLKAWKKELDFNIGSVDELIKETTNLKAAIGSNGMNTYYGQFLFTKILWFMQDKALMEGLLYAVLKEEDIRKLQNAAIFFNINGQNFISDRINLIKLGQEPTPLHFVNYIERELAEHKQSIQNAARIIGNTKIRFWEVFLK